MSEQAQTNETPTSNPMVEQRRNERLEALGDNEVSLRAQLARKIMLEQVRLDPYVVVELQSLLAGLTYSSIGNTHKWQTFFAALETKQHTLAINFLINASNNWVVLAFKDQNEYVTFVSSLVDKMSVANNSKTVLPSSTVSGFNAQESLDTLSHNPIIVFLLMLHFGGMFSVKELTTLAAENKI